MSCPALESPESLYLAASENLHRRNLSLALSLFRQAEEWGFDADRCAAGRWECYMLLGDFEKAWRESDAISLRGKPDNNRFWDGAPFNGKNVIVRCLHGLGDVIHYSRYFPLLRSRANHIAVEGPAQLLPLLFRMPGVDAVCSWELDMRSPLEWNQQIEIVELPRAFRTTLATIPPPTPLNLLDSPSSNVPYLKTYDALKIGLVWAASAWKPDRSIQLAGMLPLLQIDGPQFFSLQGGPERSELLSLPSSIHLIDLIADSPSLAQTAERLLHLDLIITVDTMMAHLAGTVGRPVWLLLASCADWRWMLDRVDSPWYPSMRIFRQPAPGDWHSVVRELAENLIRFVSRFRAATAREW
jgi:ADP-heptose:LPS heptosyltransferase